MYFKDKLIARIRAARWWVHCHLYAGVVWRETHADLLSTENLLGCAWLSQPESTGEEDGLKTLKSVLMHSPFGGRDEPAHSSSPSV